MASTVYQFDSVSQNTYLTNAGAWGSDSNGPYYYTIIPLEVGKAYKVTLQNVTTLARFRVAQLDSNAYGSAEISFVGYHGTPQNGKSLVFVAEKDYLICYGGTANGGEVVLTRLASAPDLTGTRWRFNKNFTHLYNGASNNDWFHSYTVEAQATFGDITVDIPQVRGSYDHNQISFPSSGVMSLRPHAICFPTYGNGSSYYPYSYAQYISSDASNDNAGKWVVIQYPNMSSTDRTETVYEGDAYITFTGGEDATNIELINYIGRIATLVEEEPTATVITYNGETIATLEAGQTATIKTAETEVEHDIVITPAFPINIAYGDIIATANEGQTATVKCANTEADFDIVVSAKAEEQSGDFLTFSSPSSFTLSTKNTAKNWDGTLEYSTDTSTWSTWDGATTLSADNGKLYLRGTGNTVITGEWYNRCWVLDGSNIACEGNIENLLDYATVANGEHPAMADLCFNSLFWGCKSLISAPALPAMTLTSSCYGAMFGGASLVNAPELPAATMADNCYNYMFTSCTSLTSAPALPAMKLAWACYRQMFEGCTSLVNAPVLPAMIMDDDCYCEMFEGCTSLVNAPALPAMALADTCYKNMFNGCTSLASIPALPATTLKKQCYEGMFQYSSVKMSLEQTEEYCNEYRIPTSGTATNADYATQYMFIKTSGTYRYDGAINTTYYTSNVVVYPEEPEGDDSIVGTWLFNETISRIPNEIVGINFKYLDNSRNGIGMKVLEKSSGAFGSSPYLAYYRTDTNAWTEAYSYGSNIWWTGYEVPLRTIVFETEQTVSAEFYEWFTANATKQ